MCDELHAAPLELGPHGARLFYNHKAPKEPKLHHSEFIAYWINEKDIPLASSLSIAVVENPFSALPLKNLIQQYASVLHSLSGGSTHHAITDRPKKGSAGD